MGLGGLRRRSLGKERSSETPFAATRGGGKGRAATPRRSVLARSLGQRKRRGSTGKRSTLRRRGGRSERRGTSSLSLALRRRSLSAKRGGRSGAWIRGTFRRTWSFIGGLERRRLSGHGWGRGQLLLDGLERQFDRLRRVGFGEGGTVFVETTGNHITQGNRHSPGRQLSLQ